MFVAQEPSLLDIRSLWRIPAPLSKRSEQARLSKVIGIRQPGIIDLSPSDLWSTLFTPSTAVPETTEPHTVVAIIGDFLRDKVEEKSLPW